MLRSPTFCWGWAAAALSLASAGCATLQSSSERAAAQAQVIGNPATQCTIDVRAASKAPHVGTMEIGEETMVSQVLAKSGAAKKFARLNIELYRQLPNGAWHKMGVQYDRGSKQVEPMHDYHVRPGDRVVITEDTADMFDDMMTSAMGPLGGLNKK